MEEETKIEEPNNPSQNLFLEAVLNYFSEDLIKEGMKARIKQQFGFRNDDSEDPNDLVILEEWRKFSKEAAMNLIGYIRNVRHQEINKEIEDFIRQIAPEELLK